MKISKSTILKIGLSAGLFFFSQLSFATDPQPLPIPKDGTPIPQPVLPNRVTMDTETLPASATISDIELAVYFEWPVGDATITVYDAYNQIVYQETVDTEVITELVIPVDMWNYGSYMITVTYGTTTQRGYFAM